MGQKKAAIQRTGGNASLDMNLQDVMDGIEDKLFVIDREYRCLLYTSPSPRDRS